MLLASTSTLSVGSAENAVAATINRVATVTTPQQRLLAILVNPKSFIGNPKNDKHLISESILRARDCSLVHRTASKTLYSITSAGHASTAEGKISASLATPHSQLTTFPLTPAQRQSPCAPAGRRESYQLAPDPQSGSSQGKLGHRQYAPAPRTTVNPN